VKRILLLLALLPSLAFGQEVIITNSGTTGLWTNTAVWTGGVVPNSATQTAVIANSALISNTTAVAVSNLIVNTGTINLTGNNISVGGTLTQTGGYVICTPPSSRQFNLGFDRLVVSGGTFTNCTISLTSLGDISVLASNANIKVLRIIGGVAGGLTVANVTNTALSQIQMNAGNLVVSNVYFLTGSPTIRTTGGNAPITFISSGGTITPTGSSSNNWTVINSNLILNGMALQANSVVYFSNCNLSAFSTVTLPASSSVTNSTLTITGAATLTTESAVFDAITSSATLTLAGALTAGTLTNYARMTTVSNVVTATTIYSTNTITAGATTFTVSNFTANTWQPGTSVVRLTSGGVFNSTNGATLSVVSGNVTLATNTVLSGTLYAEAPGASLTGGTLTVGGDSIFYGQFNNVNVRTNSKPVTVWRGGTNTDGNVWYWPKGQGN
jgi:hypothetical protein